LTPACKASSSICFNIFEQFEIQPDSQKYYDAVKAAIPSQGSIQNQIKGCMKLYYGAYGTIARAGNELLLVSSIFAFQLPYRMGQLV
jgi:hypothetical protein